MVRTNLDGAFHGCQAVLPTMISQRAGRIINISSLSALLAPAGQTNYAAAKAGLVGLTQSLAKEVARMNITVNAVCPGLLRRRRSRGLGPEERKAAQARYRCGALESRRKWRRRCDFWLVLRPVTLQALLLKIDGGIM